MAKHKEIDTKEKKQTGKEEKQTISAMTQKGAKMDTKLSAVLLDGGFFPVLGTIERMGMDNNVPVRQGTPFTWDANNGILVVYDERGWPWVTLWQLAGGAVARLEKDFNLQRGAFVPHSNDSGAFVHTVVLPALSEGGEK